MEIEVNGAPTRAEIEPSRTLLEYLREEQLLRGTKLNCNDGDCGGCTVLLDGEPVNACLVLAVDADGHDVTTVEGLSADGELHPVQRAFVEESGLQCGFCTPGMMLSTLALLRDVPEPSDADIRLRLAGNMCRCTGYVKIFAAVRRAADLIAERAEVTR
ncbi:MAG TPA: (2Fe-2S)-binding protein [Conexibacter sp.]|nr:(2Fe-2S)-binding protein [Conexibacter sp.]